MQTKIFRDTMTEETPINDYMTNSEVFEALTEQLSKDSGGTENTLAASCMHTELGAKVLQYLEGQPAKLQTRESLEEFLRNQAAIIGDDKISAAQTIQIINQVPVNDVEMKVLLDDRELLDKAERAQLIAAVVKTTKEK